MNARSQGCAWLSSAVLLLVLATAAIGTQVLLERQRPSSAMAAELSFLPKGQYLKTAVLGYQHVVADLIWIRAVQHFGDLKQTQQGYVWAYHAADVVTDLDPKFVFAYQAAGTVLGVWAGRLTESTAILKKGMQHNPHDWHLPPCSGATTTMNSVIRFLLRRISGSHPNCPGLQATLPDWPQE